MQTVKKIVQTTKTVRCDVEQERIVTSDGREFYMHEKERAERWEKTIQEIKAFKETHNFKEPDLTIVPGGSPEYPYEYQTSFTFQVKDGIDWKDVPSNLIKSRVDKGKHGSYISPGKYLYIEYMDDSGDYSPYFCGYFGLVQDYIKGLENDVIKLNTYLIDAKTKLLND